MFLKLLLLCIVSVVFSDHCYFNAPCTYQKFSSKTPYDSVRGDIREAPDVHGCSVAAIWSLHRHGNRNPGSSVIDNMKKIRDKLLVEIGKQFEHNNYTHCIQDYEDCLLSRWNSTIETSSSYLTGTGYEELYGIGKRIRQRFPNITKFPTESFYFRPTNEQRTITSATAFVHGLTEGTGLDLFRNIDSPKPTDDVIRPYELCTKYQEEVKNSKILADELAAYDSSSELLSVKDRVQERLKIDYQITADETYDLYEYCRFYRSWSPNLKDPWCAFFSDEDLEILEYRDDVRHYYRNGYGSEVNVKLGSAPLHDLHDNFEGIIDEGGEQVISYFTHDTMFEMVISALGLYKDLEPLRGSKRDPNRSWRTSEIASLATNLIAVLYRCDQSDLSTHRVQIFINEKNTSLCPDEGCSRLEFENKFKIFSKNNNNFCESNDNDGTNGSNSNNMRLLTLFIFALPAMLVR